jgi:hypothetical protein
MGYWVRVMYSIWCNVRVYCVGVVMSSRKGIIGIDGCMMLRWSYLRRFMIGLLDRDWVIWIEVMRNCLGRRNCMGWWLIFRISLLNWIDFMILFIYYKLLWNEYIVLWSVYWLLCYMYEWMFIIWLIGCRMMKWLRWDR